MHGREERENWCADRPLVAANVREVFTSSSVRRLWLARLYPTLIVAQARWGDDPPEESARKRQNRDAVRCGQSKVARNVMIRSCPWYRASAGLSGRRACQSRATLFDIAPTAAGVRLTASTRL